MSDGNTYTEFLNRYYDDAIKELAEDYPERKTLAIDFKLLDNFEGLGDLLLTRPDVELESLREALVKYELPIVDNINESQISIKNLPANVRIPIALVGAEHANKMIAIEGKITKIAPPYQKLVYSAFRCPRCDSVTYVPQPGEDYQEPVECSNETCGRRVHFRLVPEMSTFEDWQKLAIQENHECAKPGQPLREVIVVLRGRELSTSLPGMGTQCIVNGIVRLQQKRDSSTFTASLEAGCLEPEEAEMDFSISEADKREFRQLAAKGNIMQTLIYSTAPEILGYDQIKVAALCAVVSSGSYNSRFRECMHVVIVGDPAVGKSALMKFIREVVPRAQYSAGKGSTVAGLTVAVVKDELSGGGFTAQAGALVLADGGVMILDDVDKLEPEDFQALNSALEEGFIELHKAGINQRFSTRCSVIALCNPKRIRFDDYKPLSEQINIPADTLSRFDLIFKILDLPDPAKDKLVAEHQAKMWAQYEGSNQQDEPEPEGSRISQEKLSKYLQFAKTFKPRTTPEVRKAITDYYLSLRKTDITEALISTPRQNNGMYRLAKSIAKLRLSNECTIADVELAIGIHQASLEAIRDPITGRLDVDSVHGMEKSQRDRMRMIRDTMTALQGSNGNTVPLELIMQTLEAEGIERDYVEDTIGRLKTAGDIIETSAGRYKAVI